ncbi:MAG: CBS domain-containing protein [Gemmatimonadota bacterium]|nr:CBS domain-containing protein [Gemmatimonadota bacterium]
MSRLHEIMTSEIKAVSPETTLRELAEFFVDEEVTGAPVVSGRTLMGVVSATDLLEFDAEQRAVPAYRDAPGSRTAGLDGLEPWNRSEGDPPARYFAELYEDAGAEVRTRLESEGPEWDVMDEHAVSEVMTRQVLSLPPDAEVREAAALMIEAGVHRILVIDDGDLVGLVTTTDIMRAVADHGLA